jgi:hypothetical protein
VAKKPPAKNLLAEFSDGNAEGPRRKCAPAVEAAKKKPEAPKPLAVQAEPSSSKTSVRLEPQQHMLTQYQPPSKVRGATGNRKIDGFQGSMFHVGHFVFELIENKQRLSRMHFEIDIALKRDKGDYGLPLNAPRMLLNAIAQGDLAPLEPDRMELLQSLDKLNEIATTGYFSNTKFVHIEPAQPKLRIAASQASASARLDIYFGEGSDAETIFGLAADYDVWTLMSHITPAGPIKRPPPPPQVYAGTPEALAERRAKPGWEFTPAGLMKEMENQGHPAVQQPAGLRLTLRHFQLQTLGWMLAKEREPNGLNGLLWEEWSTPAGVVFYYNRVAGELSRKRPPRMTGGFVCEEMGLGKTVECLALILANPPPSKIQEQAAPLALRYAKKAFFPEPLQERATLIVVPLTLLEQWVCEIEKCIEKGKLTCAVHHGVSAVTDLNELANHDVIPPRAPVSPTVLTSARAN